MSFQTCRSFFRMLNTKEDGNQTVDGPHWLPLYFFIYYRSQWEPTTVWFFKILQNIFFGVQHKKEMYTGLERHEGK